LSRLFERRAVLRYATKAALGAGIAYAVSQVPTSILPAYAQEQQVVEVPYAVVRPNVNDGKYTPVQELELTEIGKQAVANNPKLMPQHEWDDSTVGKYAVLKPSTLGEQSNPEWYLALKHDERRLYLLLDAISELAVGESSGAVDRRQSVGFLFDTDNTPISQVKNGTPNSYNAFFYFLSNKTLESGIPSDVQGSYPGVPMPREYYEYNWSISESPPKALQSGPSKPHIIIEASFDLSELTRNSRTAYIRSRGLDNHTNVLGVENDFNLSSAQVVPETPWPEIALTAGIGIGLGALVLNRRRISRRAFLGMR
jgi:hypothetical protein